MDIRENELHARFWQAKAAQAHELAVKTAELPTLYCLVEWHQENSSYFALRAREHLFEALGVKAED